MDIYVRADVLVVATNSYDSIGPDTPFAAALDWLRARGIDVEHNHQDSGTL